MPTNLDYWSVAVLSAGNEVRKLGLHHTIIFRRYSLKLIGVTEDRPVADNDDEFVIPNV